MPRGRVPRGLTVIIRVFQKFLNPNESLKYENFISFRVQTRYFEQYSIRKG